MKKNMETKEMIDIQIVRANGSIFLNGSKEMNEEIMDYLLTKNYDVFFAQNINDENVTRVRPADDKILLDIIKYTVKNGICSEILI